MIAPFVDIDWVEAHRDEVVLADCRWYMDGRSGRAAYEGGHVPGAVFVDLDTALTRHADPAEGGRHPLPEPEAFAAAMGALGIGDEDTVVAYDDAGGVIAARLVWMLRATGHEAALLDGGLGAWRGELDATAAVRAPAEFTAREWPAERLATIDEVAAATCRGPTGPACRRSRPLRPSSTPASASASKANPTRRPAGRPHPRRPQRPLPREPRRRRAPAPGRATSAPASTSATHEVVSYCGSGVTACHNLLAMEQAGLGPGSSFPRLLVAVESRPRPACTDRREPTRLTG